MPTAINKSRTVTANTLLNPVAQASVAASPLTPVYELQTQDVNLTTQGNIDWLHIGAAIDVKSGVNTIGFSASGATQQYTNHPYHFIWSDGKTNANGNVTSGALLQGRNQYNISIPINSTTAGQLLTVYFGLYNGSCDFRVAVDSNQPYSVYRAVDNGGTGSNGVYYKASIVVPSVGRLLNITYINPSGIGNADLQAITLGARKTSVLTQRGDLNRSGVYSSEVVLNASNINVSTFGKVASLPVDGQTYAQTLCLSNILIGGQMKNVVYAATMHNSVYCFDADSLSTIPIWKNALGSAVALPDPNIVNGSTKNIKVEIGILSTPVISRENNAIYVVRFTKIGTTYAYYLHSLNLTTGLDNPNSPVVVTATAFGDGAGSANSLIPFNPLVQNQRSALTLTAGRVYFTFSALEDYGNYHGWIFAYDAISLAQRSFWNSTPNGIAGGIWQSGNGMCVDSSGNLYCMSCNGTNDARYNLGDTFLKHDKDLNLIDFFTPYNQNYLDIQDLDLGSAGPVLIPGNRMISCGKEGRFYLVSTTSLGKQNPTLVNDSQILQSFIATGVDKPGLPGSATTGQHKTFGSPIYWESNSGKRIYLWSEQDWLRAYNYDGCQLNPVPFAYSTVQTVQGEPGGILALSCNNQDSASAVLWASTTKDASAESATVSGILRAYNPITLQEIWNSLQNNTRDDVGTHSKFCPPVVSNGRVYLGNFSGQLSVYGILGGAGAVTLISVGRAVAPTTVNLTALGNTDWFKFGNRDRKNGTPVIQVLSLNNSVSTFFNSTPTSYQWSNGTTVATQAGDTNGEYTEGGYQITVPIAGNAGKTLLIYVGAYYASGTLSLNIDSQSASYTDTQTANEPAYTVYSVIVPNTGTNLIATYSDTSNSGNISIEAVALGNPSAVVAAFTSSPATGSAPLAVSFTNTSTNAASYSWNFGDGTALSTATSPSHTFTVAGIYSVALTATGASGSNTTTQSITVTNASTITASFAAQPANADLTPIGSVDWFKYGNRDRKNIATAIIQTAFVNVANGNVYNNTASSYQWEDGKTILNKAGDTSGEYIIGIGNGFKITIPIAGNAGKKLRIYLNIYSATSNFSLQVDTQAIGYANAQTATAGDIVNGFYTVIVPSTGTNLVATYVMGADSGGQYPGNVALIAVTLG